MGIPDHLACLLRNLYAGQEAAVRTGHGTTDWLQIGKGVQQDCSLSSCLFNLYAVSSVQSQSYLTLCDLMDFSTLGFPVHHHFPEPTQLMSSDSVITSNHLILCHPLLSPPSTIPRIRVFPNESILPIRWPKYWSFSFSIKEYLGLISFRVDWFDLHAVQGTLKSLLQQDSSKASILQCSVFFIVQV